jgi:hypothetical protein
MPLTVDVRIYLLSVFEGAVAFQSVFYLEMYQNNIILFFKNYFLYQHIKII